jgi:restriction endonuclease Mrr
MNKPTITKTNHPLPFAELSPLQFERLCLWLVDRQGYLRPQHLGEAGNEQGRDIIAYKATDAGEQLWYFQCKRYKSIGAKTFTRLYQGLEYRMVHAQSSRVGGASAKR